MSRKFASPTLRKNFEFFAKEKPMTLRIFKRKCSKRILSLFRISMVLQRAFAFNWVNHLVLKQCYPVYVFFRTTVVPPGYLLTEVVCVPRGPTTVVVFLKKRLNLWSSSSFLQHAFVTFDWSINAAITIS